MAAARGMLPVPQDVLLELLVALRADADESVARAAEETLTDQDAVTLLGVASAQETAPAVLSYLAERAGLAREVQESLALNASTPDEAVAALARATAEGAVLELVSLNQQRLIRTPAIIDAVLANPARTSDADRRVRETRREFFEKERGARQVADEMRAQGLSAAAEFIESAESFGAEAGLSLDDAWLIAQHIEVSDVDIDDSWLPSERYEDLLDETFEQRQAAAERLVAEALAEGATAAPPERVALIRRIMLMKVKDRMKLGMKGDREARSILIRDPNKVVAQAVINNPRITDQEVEAIAAMRTVSRRRAAPHRHEPRLGAAVPDHHQPRAQPAHAAPDRDVHPPAPPRQGAEGARPEPQRLRRRPPPGAPPRRSPRTVKGGEG